MNDDALTSWLADGAPVALSSEERLARQRADFVRRFADALDPPFDLGPTDELHQEGLARAVYAVHRELNELGDVEYLAVWGSLSAPVRRAIKAYVEMGAKL